MKTDNKDRFYDLLPAIHRMRDQEQGEPLRALLHVIAEQADIVEDDISKLYENWFIETCEDWVVPYIGSLVGYQSIHEAGEPGETITARTQARNKILIPRGDVANTLRYRRRKGTLALLEQLAKDVADWPARAVEFHRLLGWTQALNHQRLEQGGTVDMRRGDALDCVDGPFDEMAHTIDVRRIASRRVPGRFNLPSVGLFVWRLKTYSITHAPAYCVENRGSNCYSFSSLGNDIPLYTRPEPDTEPTKIAEESNLPVRIRRRAFQERGIEKGEEFRHASSAYYGLVKNTLIGNSLSIWAPDWPETGAEQPIPQTCIIPADLSEGKYQPLNNQVAVDPVLGRITFPSKQMPKKGVWVSYHYGFSDDIGGGEYDRPLSQPSDSVIRTVSGQEQLKDELKLYRAGPDGQAPENQPPHTVIEIRNSGSYVLPVNITLKENHSLQIRAAKRKRPLIRILDWFPERPDNFSVTGGAGSRFTLDGLIIAGRGIRLEGNLAGVIIRHSTLVPGWSIDTECAPVLPAEPSLEVVNTYPCVLIEHSILGSIKLNLDEVARDPMQIRISDSILDATGEDCDKPECEAIGAVSSPFAHATVQFIRSTVIGRVRSHAIRLAENSIFMGPITVARRQIGCMRFSYVTPGSRTPRRYNCQPDMAARSIAEEMLKEAHANSKPPPNKEVVEKAQQLERDRVRPIFNSLRYGTPTYCQLSQACAGEISRGADDESEMGVFHDLYQPQRTSNLRTRLEEYTPAGADVGIIFSS